MYIHIFKKKVYIHAHCLIPVKQLSACHQLQYQSDVSVRLKDLLQLDLRANKTNWILTERLHHI